MSSHDFPVGSIVYFLHNKTERVLPAQVTEKIVRTSVSGSRATYIITVKSKDSLKNIEIDPEEVSVFQTPDEMKSFMVTRATVAITSLITSAVRSSEIFQNVTKVLESPTDEPGEFTEIMAGLREANEIAKKFSPTNALDSPADDGYAEVDLGDGKIARLKMDGVS